MNSAVSQTGESLSGSKAEGNNDSHHACRTGTGGGVTSGSSKSVVLPEILSMQTQLPPFLHLKYVLSRAHSFSVSTHPSKIFPETGWNWVDTTLPLLNFYFGIT